MSKKKKVLIIVLGAIIGIIVSTFVRNVISEMTIRSAVSKLKSNISISDYVDEEEYEIRRVLEDKGYMEQYDSNGEMIYVIE